MDGDFEEVPASEILQVDGTSLVVSDVSIAGVEGTGIGIGANSIELLLQGHFFEHIFKADPEEGAIGAGDSVVANSNSTTEGDNVKSTDSGKLHMNKHPKMHSVKERHNF